MKNTNIINKRNINAIIVLIFSISLLFCAQNLPENTIDNTNTGTEVTPNVEETNVITFVDPVIEMVIREELEQSTGDIKKEQVLEITKLDIWGPEIKELYGYSKIESLEDLKWLKNLEYLSLKSCNIDNLDCIQNLVSLKALFVSNNQIVNLEPLENLTNLTHLYCGNNLITDYTPLRKLTNLKSLIIDKNQSTDLSFLSEMTELEFFSASECGISDITVLETLTKLDDLDLSYNQISDISALKNLDNLTYLNLESNQITDLTPIMHLADQLYIPNFYNNPIPEDNWMAFFYPIEENHVVTTIRKSIGANMPEFTFEIYSYFEPEDEEYQVYKIEISDTELFQSISIPELTIFGQTHITEYDNLDTMGLVFVDLNFDGYMDLRLFDNYNGNYRKEWLYFVWNPEVNQFQYDDVLRSISLPVFDAENQLIYGMERGSAIDHYYSTYKYIDAELILIEYVEHESIYALHTNEEIEAILSMASIEPCNTEESHYVPLHEKITRYNETTKEMKTIVDNYIIYLRDRDDFDYGDELLRVDVSSEIGLKIKQMEDDYYNQ